MSHQLIIELARNAMLTALLLAGPLLLAALVVGLLVSVVQAVTQIQEQTLSFVPKLLAIAIVLLVALPWMLQVIIRYTVELFRSIPALVS
jgi:flagellar biosynthetic protein FliQ